MPGTSPACWGSSLWSGFRNVSGISYKVMGKGAGNHFLHVPVTGFLVEKSLLRGFPEHFRIPGPVFLFVQVEVRGVLVQMREAVKIFPGLGDFIHQGAEHHLVLEIIYPAVFVQPVVQNHGSPGL